MGRRSVLLVLAICLMGVYVMACATTPPPPENPVYEQSKTMLKNPYEMSCSELKQELIDVARLKQRVLEENAKAQKQRNMTRATMGVLSIVSGYAPMPSSGISTGDLVRIVAKNLDATSANKLTDITLKHGTLDNYHQVLRDAWNLNGCQFKLEKEYFEKR